MTTPKDLGDPIARFLLIALALTLVVTVFGGWPKFSDALHTGGMRARNRFLVAFGRACASLANSRANGALSGKARRVHNGEQERQRAP